MRVKGTLLLMMDVDRSHQETLICWFLYPVILLLEVSWLVITFLRALISEREFLCMTFFLGTACLDNLFAWLCIARIVCWHYGITWSQMGHK